MELNAWQSPGDGRVQAMFTKLGVLIRDKDHPDKVVLAFTWAEWTAFREGVHAGEFDEKP